MVAFGEKRIEHCLDIEYNKTFFPKIVKQRMNLSNLQHVILLRNKWSQSVRFDKVRIWYKNHIIND